MAQAGRGGAVASGGAAGAGSGAGGSGSGAGGGAGTGASATAGMSGLSGGAGRGDAGAPSTGSGGLAGSGGRESSGGAPDAGRGGRSMSGSGGAATAGRANGGAGGNITLWLAGDSTVANGETPCPVGWGKVFDALFDDRVTVTNSAVGGRSVHTWLYNVQKTMDASGECALELDQNGDPVLQARWTAMLSGMKAGDYLFIQFGINDGDPSCDRHVGLDAFKESYGMMAAAAKERGAQPIFVTPTSSISCNGNAAQGTRGGYVTTTIDAGNEFDVPVIDLHAKSVALYTSLGFCPLAGGDVSASTTGPVGDFFCDDHTHFDTPGAKQIAGLVTQALVAQGLPLAAYVK
jgi:lysophospholipase L1-like esterase